MIRKSVAEILDHHVTFELEAIDRMYLNGYVPSLQTGGGVAYFMKQQLGARVPSTTMIAPMSQPFVDGMERFVELVGTVFGSTLKGLIAGAIIGAFARRVGSLTLGLIFGLAVG